MNTLTKLPTLLDPFQVMSRTLEMQGAAYKTAVSAWQGAMETQIQMVSLASAPMKFAVNPLLAWPKGLTSPEREAPKAKAPAKAARVAVDAKPAPAKAPKAAKPAPRAAAKPAPVMASVSTPLPKDVVNAAKAPAEPAKAPAPVAAKVAAPKPAAPKAGPAAPVAKPVATKTVTAAPAKPAPAAKPVSKPAPAPVAAAAKAPAPAANAGPELLKAARGGKADDLTKIKGIGPKLAAECNKLGIYHFDQIASWSKDEQVWIDETLGGIPGCVMRDNWVAQAKLLAKPAPKGK